MRHVVVGVVGVLWLTLATSCSEETATQVLVRFEADDAATARATSLRVQIVTVGETDSAFDEVRAVPAEVTFPATVPVVPRGGDTTRRFRVLGELSDDVGVFSTVMDELGFVEGELRQVTLTFVLEADDAGPSDAGVSDADARDAGDSCGPCPCPSDVCAAGACTPADPVAEVRPSEGFVCARTEGGAVFCWGTNESGQLGLGDLGLRRTPEAPALTDALDIGVGRRHACAVRDGGAIECWGRGGAWITTGGGDPDVLVPTAISNPTGASFALVAAGREHTCAVTTGGVAFCWGADDFGQIGNGAGSGNRQPRSVDGSGTGWLSISLGDNHTCGLDGTHVRCHGTNGEGQLGAGGMVSGIQSPSRERSNGDFRFVGTGRSHTCAVAVDGSLFCFGRNNFGQIGTPPPGDVSWPRQIGTDTDWMAVDGGHEHTCGIRAPGALYCWGDNAVGQLGRPAGAASEERVQVGTDDDWIFVDGGDQLTCGIRAGGFLSCWGRNSAGQLGLGDIMDRDTPTRVCLP